MKRGREAQESDVVRLAQDDADTVIWFPGPVDYDEVSLSADLVAALEAWERFFYEHEKAEGHVVSVEAMPHYRDEGIRLARWLATEIGSRFVVEFNPDGRYPAPRRFRAASPATNRAAARDFARLSAKNEMDLHGNWSMTTPD